MKRNLMIPLVLILASAVWSNDITVQTHEWATAQIEEYTTDEVIEYFNGREAISYGSETVFNPVRTRENAAIAVDACTFVVAYIDWDNSRYGTAVIGTVNGTTISYSSEFVFNTAVTSSIAIALLSPTTFVVAYLDHAGVKGNATIGTISGGEITFGSEYTFDTEHITNIGVAGLGASKIAIAYRDQGDSGNGNAIIGTINGTSISYGTEQFFNPGVVSYNQILGIDDSSFVLAYMDGPDNQNGNARIVTVNGTTMTFNTEYTFNDGTTRYISMGMLEDSHISIVFSDDANSDYGTAVIGIIDGTTIGYGSEYVFKAANTTQTKNLTLSGNTFAAAYIDVDNSSHGTAIIGSVSGTTISYDTESVFHAGATNYVTGAALSGTRFVPIYTDVDNSEHGTGIVGLTDTIIEGACCYDGGYCMVQSEADCCDAGGIYSGDDTVCDPNSCPYCGNSVLDEGEECDNGDILDCDQCTSDCQIAGDVNQDAMLDVSDIVLYIDAILFYTPLPEGDITCDGITDVVDVVLLISWIMGDTLNLSNSTLISAELNYGNDSVSIDADGTVAGIQLNVSGNFRITESYIPAGWQVHSSERIILLISVDGSPLNSNNLFSYNGNLQINSSIITGWNGQIITADNIVMPDGYVLEDAYPNPFNPVSTISYSLPIGQHVSLVIYNVLGEQVDVLVNEFKAGGFHQINWDAGSRASGAYLVKMSAGSFTETKKILLIR